MFILRRQDVEISSVQHPRKDQKIPILMYQGMTFRLLSVFQAHQEDSARSLWRDLTDNQGKACVLLEEPDRYSIWGKVRLDQLTSDLPMSGTPSADNFSPVFVQATLLMLQTIYLDVEDLMGSKQGNAFQRDITALFQKAKLAGTGTPDAIQQLLTADPLNSLQPPAWREAQVISLLQEIHRLGRSYFGNSGFTRNVLESLQDLSTGDRTAFSEWLLRSPVGSLWK